MAILDQSLRRKANGKAWTKCSFLPQENSNPEKGQMGKQLSRKCRILSDSIIQSRRVEIKLKT